MKIQMVRGLHRPSRPEAEKRRLPLIPVLVLILVSAFSLFLWSCMEEGEPTDQPEQVTRTFEAKEKYVLQALAGVFNEKDLGKAAINAEAHEVTSDYVYQGEWRTRSLARTRQVNWKETEVTLTVTTEKKTSTGWQMRRLLGPDQYKKIFKAIESRIYREMYKTE
jgi:hypothetical protein